MKFPKLKAIFAGVVVSLGSLVYTTERAEADLMLDAEAAPFEQTSDGFFLGNPYNLASASATLNLTKFTVGPDTDPTPEEGEFDVFFDSGGLEIDTGMDESFSLPVNAGFINAGGTNAQLTVFDSTAGTEGITVTLQNYIGDVEDADQILAAFNNAETYNTDFFVAHNTLGVTEFGRGETFTLNLRSVPEPSALVCLAVGAGGFAVASRRRRPSLPDKTLA